MPNEYGDAGLSPEQLYAVLEGVRDALVVTEPSGEVIFMNSAAKRLYGVEGPHCANGQGFNLLDHVVDELDAYTLDGVPVADKDHPLLRALKGEPYADVELLIKLPEQDEPHVHRFSGTRASTEPPFNILTIRDETVRWRAERRYRVAFEADPAPSVIARLSDTTIVEANEGMSELTGLSQEELQERALVDLKPLDSSEHLKDVAERLKEGKRVHKVKRLLLNDDNDVVPVLLSARSVEVDGESCGIFTFIDMSELETARREQRETEAKLNSAIEEHAVEKAAMSRLVLTDSLTGIANRRALNIRMAEERSRAQRYDDTFSILVLDLDRFKSLNDTYGHTTGDRVLREVAQLLQEEYREADMAGRWGGEEFMMILPQIDLAEAAEVAERIRRRIKETTFSDGVRATISIGVASYGDGHTTGGLFAKADRALYAAKAGGRDRVEVASPDPTGA